jgi:hypothetical protein
MNWTPSGLLSHHDHKAKKPQPKPAPTPPDLARSASELKSLAKKLSVILILSIVLHPCPK